MSKIYRRPKVNENQLKMQKGKVDGDIDFCIFYGENIPRCDRALFFNTLCSKRMKMNWSKNKPEFEQSFLEELEERGYDIDTLKISVKLKKENKNEI